MSRSARIKGSQGRLLPVISPLDLNQRPKGESSMCEIIPFKSRPRLHVPASNVFRGVIDVYCGENGKVGIDACVPAEFVAKIRDDILPGVVSLFDDGNGRVGFDTQISSHAADSVLAAAHLAHISIQH
jgi:hypothetical protein